MKLVLPIEEMTKQIAMPGPFLRFIGVAEVLGGLGLVLPGLTGIRPRLTPLAAAGLVIIMIGATVVSFAIGVLARRCSRCWWAALWSSSPTAAGGCSRSEPSWPRPFAWRPEVTRRRSGWS